MRWSILFTGFALFLIFEGMLPFAAPSAWRRAVAQMAELSDGHIRMIGGIIMFLGVILLLALGE